jgi:hypothetical protein
MTSYIVGCISLNEYYCISASCIVDSSKVFPKIYLDKEFLCSNGSE